MKPAGLILAAGESRRMGSPKALLEYRGETFVERLVRLFRARCSPVIVVRGAPWDRTPPCPAMFIANARYQLGQLTSMQCGLRVVPSDSDGVLFTLVDHPAVSRATIDALLAEPRPLLRVPRYQEKRGHPIWFSRDLIAEFLALPETGAARDVVRAHADETEFLDLDDPGIVADIDDPEAYRRLMEAEA